jgi:hypothetical protein
MLGKNLSIRLGSPWMSFLYIFSAVVAVMANQPVVSGGVQPAESVQHTYQVVCAGQSASIQLEERWDRNVPAGSVRVVGWGSSSALAKKALPASVQAAVGSMARINRAGWSCSDKGAVLTIEFLDRNVHEQAVQSNKPVLSLPGATRTIRLLVTRDNLLLT